MKTARVLLLSSCLLVLFSYATSNDPVFSSTPGNFTVQSGRPGPLLNCTISTDVGIVNWIVTIRGETIRIFGADEYLGFKPAQRSVYFTNLLNQTGLEVTDQDRVTALNVPIAKIRQHGTYQCRASGYEIYTETGSLNVTGQVEMHFFEGQLKVYFVPENPPSPVVATATAGGNLEKKLVVYGAPDPTLSLAKRGTDGVYRLVNDDRVTLNLTRFIFSSIQLSDDGEYKIWGNNSYGDSEYTFRINVTGVDPPNVQLPHTMYTTYKYGQDFTIECTIQQNAHEPELLLYWTDKNGANISNDSQSSVWQRRLRGTAVELSIRDFNTSHNGNYTCHAQNSNTDNRKHITLIGPPAKVGTPTVTVSGKIVHLIWEEPNGFGATISNYSLFYTRTSPREEKRLIVTDYSGGHEETICTKGNYRFKIAAINQYNSMGEFSDLTQPEYVEEDCPSTSTPEPSATQDTSSNTISTTITDPGRTVTTTTTPTTVNTPGTTETQSVLPIAASAIGGGLILIMAVAVLVIAIFCWVAISKRDSNRHGVRQWMHQSSEEENIDGSGSYSNNSIPDKSTQLMIPSPLPATPGYGPAMCIDPCFEFSRENLDLTDILYDGSYTVIYKAKATGIKENKAIEVAVKSIKEEYGEMDDYVSALVNEMEHLSQLEPHPNIVGLIKVCTVGKPVYMIMEYMCHGDLLGFLRATRGHPDMYTVFPGTKNLPTNVKLRSRDLLRIISQVASGMNFLSSLKIPHGALCARNVLVGTSMEVKIFNIGAHNLDNNEVYESLVRWWAPEVFHDGSHSMTSDIWSFGVLMWEVVTVGGTPYSDIVNLEDIVPQIMSGMRLQRPAHCTQPIYDIMSSCWETIPQHRPLFLEITDQLQSLNTAKMSYLDLRNYNEMQYSQFDLDREASQMSIL